MTAHLVTLTIAADRPLDQDNLSTLAIIGSTTTAQLGDRTVEVTVTVDAPDPDTAAVAARNRVTSVLKGTVTGCTAAVGHHGEP